MNARLLTGIAGGCAAGFLAGWFLHPDASNPEDEAAMVKKMARLEADLKAKSTQVDRLTVANKKETADQQAKVGEMKRFSAESPEVKKVQDRMKRKMAEKDKLKLDEKVAALKTRLGLSDQQAAAVRALLEKNPAAGQSLIARAMAGEKVDEKGMITDMLKPGRKDAELTAKINELLTPEQQQAYTAFRQEQRTNEVEVKANKELARLQSSLTLTPDQKDKAFDVLTKLANEEYDNPVNPMAAMMEQQMKMMPKDSKNQPELAAHTEEIKAAADFAAERRKMRVDAMREVLNPEQLALYETQQKRGSLTDMIDGAFGDDMPGFFMEGAEDENEAAANGGAKPAPPKPVR